VIILSIPALAKGALFIVAMVPLSRRTFLRAELLFTNYYKAQYQIHLYLITEEVTTLAVLVALYSRIPVLCSIN
jgi:hypothetical protein